MTHESLVSVALVAFAPLLTVSVAIAAHILRERRRRARRRQQMINALGDYWREAQTRAFKQG